jgi:hypothetical protein
MSDRSAVPSYRIALSVSLLALLTLAGCSGAPGQYSPVATDTVTTTPENATGATVSPTTNASIDYEQAPPGVNESGVNTLALLSPHFEQLRNNSHTITIRTTHQRGERSVTQGKVVQVDGSTARVATTYSTSPVRSLAWSNGTTTARRDTAAGTEGLSRYTFDSRQIQLRQASGQRRVIGFLSATNFTAVDSTVESGTTLTALESVGTPGNRTARELFRTTDVSGYTVRVVVTEAGLITGIEVNATVGPARRAVAWTERYTVSEVGSTTVGRPAWIETAKQEATQLDATLSENASYLRVEHRGGAAIAEDAMVQWTTNPRRQPRTAALGIAVESGDTIYASVANGSIQFSRERPAKETSDVLSSGLLLRFATAEGLRIGSVYGVPSQPVENATPAGPGQ